MGFKGDKFISYNNYIKKLLLSEKYIQIRAGKEEKRIKKL